MTERGVGSTILFDVLETLATRVEGVKRIIARMEHALGVDGTNILLRVERVEGLLQAGKKLPEHSVEYRRLVATVEAHLDRIDESCTWASIRSIFARIEERQEQFLTPAGRDWWFTDIKPLVTSLIREGDPKGAVEVLRQTEAALDVKDPVRQGELLEGVRAVPARQREWEVKSHEQ